MQINMNNTEDMIKGTYSATKAYKSYENYNKDYSMHGYVASEYGKNTAAIGGKEITKTTEVTFGDKSAKTGNASDVYSKHGKADDMAKAEQANLANQMAQAVNNLKDMITPEGYNALSELGIIPDEENPQMVIGVCERIQMQLAAYCEDYKPVGLNIDKAKMAEVLGSEVFAKSVEKAMDIAYISDNSKAAIIKGAENLTIDEVYKYAHSVGNTENVNSNVATVEQEAWDNLKSQVEKLFNKVGIEVNEENMNTAKWMLEYNVPLTEDNIIKTIKVNEMLAMPQEEFAKLIKENISLNMYFTGSAHSALFSKDQYNTRNISEALKVLDKATDEDVNNVLSEGKILNIANLRTAIEAKLTTSGVVAKELSAFSAAVTTKSVIVTARAILTSTSLLRMQQVGIDVNMTSLTEMINIEKQGYENFAEGYLLAAGVSVTEENTDIFINSLQAASNIRNASISMVAGVSVESTLHTAGSVAMATSVETITSQMTIKVTTDNSVSTYEYELTSKGIVTNSYEAAKAIAIYDSVGTSVRRDMGDTYNKAFRNIDELLEAIDVDKNTSTRRAARILGYNAMDITKDNIQRVEAVATEIDYLVNNLTPKTVSYLIANGINPLDMEIKSLNEELKRINEELGITENEDYAKYLWQLDKAGAISKEDRDKYISIYRTIKAITKKDSRAIGAALLCDYELTMDNLLTAERNRRYSGEMDMTARDMEYMKYQTELMKDMGTVTEAEVTELINHNVDVNIKNIKKLKELKEGNKAFINLYETGGKSVKDIIDNIFEDIDNAFESEETLQNTMEELKDAATTELKEARESEMPTFSNINAALDNFGLVNIMSAYAKTSSYYVPMEIGGQVTGIHLTIRHSENISKVNTYIKESVYGRMSLEVSITQSKISGMLVYEDTEKADSINELLKKYINVLSEAFGADSGIEDIDIKLANSSDSMFFELNEETVESEGVEEENLRQNLFTSAKLFIATIRTYEF